MTSYFGFAIVTVVFLFFHRSVEKQLLLFLGLMTLGAGIASLGAAGAINTVFTLASVLPTPLSESDLLLLHDQIDPHLLSGFLNLALGAWVVACQESLGKART
ncbi:hypothetical protein HY375_02695 [Candidatus Berkelbacteria bacterium]|nr:hypothetical protein [Candidatus Berkelbacteria bacterium]